MAGPLRHRRLSAPVIAVAAAIVLLPMLAAADTLPGGLSTQQVAKLRSQPLPILAPAYVPQGFRLVKIEVSRAKKPGDPNDYTLRYAGPAGSEFTIDVADGGFGDADPDYTTFRRAFVVNSSVVGSTTMSPYKFQSPGGGQDYWLYSSDYRMLDRLGNPHAALIFSGVKMSNDDLRRIYSSLQPVHR